MTDNLVSLKYNTTNLNREERGRKQLKEDIYREK